MKTVWKWILGIVIVLIVAGIGIGLWARQNGGLLSTPQAPAAADAPQTSPPGRAHGPDHHQGGAEAHHAGPMHGPMIDHRMSPFGGGFGMWVQWIPLAALALLLVGAYQLGRQAGVNSERNARVSG